MNRMLIKGINGVISPRPFQDAAAYTPGAPESDPLFNGYHHCHHASTLFIRAHALRNEPVMRDHYQRLAMAELDQLAHALGLEFVVRQDAVTR